MKTFYWLVKREFWETRGGFFFAPLVAGIIALVLNIMGIIAAEVFKSRMDSHTEFHSGFERAFEQSDIVQAGAVLDGTLYGVSALILSVTAIVIFFYCLGALYDDRRDRSILFWKSLPLSDTMTVLSKLASAAILAPAIAIVIGVVCGLLLMTIVAIVATMHGVNVWGLLMAAHPIRVIINLVLLIPLYALWALPTLGWLLLCSAWARSKPFLWAIALPLGAGVIVTWFGLMGIAGLPARWFWENIVGRMLGSLVPGSWFGSTNGIAIPGHSDPAALIDSMGLSFHYSVLVGPSVWIGAIAGIVMIGGAIWFRRWRDES